MNHQEGIFCANFRKQVIGSHRCLNVWCATCYRILPGDDFLIYRVDDAQSDPLNIELRAPEEDRDYLEARGGDHLFCPFECNYCTFHQLKGRPPLARVKTDDILLTYLR